ncbi:hypothetical protein, partial [Streptomyces collinus]
MKHRRPRRSLISKAVGPAGALAVALAMSSSPAMAAGATSGKASATGVSADDPDPEAPWAPENDELPLHHKAV